MSPNPSYGKCPLFPPAFNVQTPEDLFRPLPTDSDIVTLYFRDNKLDTGHYTLMWTMFKVMLKIAQSVGTGVCDDLERYSKRERISERELNWMLDKYVGAGWDKE